MYDPLRDFSDSIYSDLGAIVDPLPDGRIHRIDDPDGRRHNLACWYVLHLNGWPSGAYGNWRTGVQYNWSQKQQNSSDHGVRFRAEQMAAKAQREREQLAAQDATAKRAQSLWESTGAAQTEHPYLTLKNVPRYALRQLEGALFVPLQDAEGRLWNLQRISPNGEKRFLPGGRITGCFSLIGSLPNTGPMYVCEGWATAASIHQTTGRPVAAAMNAGNLLSVAQALIKYELVIAADNDHRTPGNPGMTKAGEAGQAVGALTIWPAIPCCSDCMCTDFNDKANCRRGADQ